MQTVPSLLLTNATHKEAQQKILGLKPIAAAIFCTTTIFSGCSTLQKNLETSALLSKPKTATNPTQRAMQLGIHAINAGNAKLANHEFTLAIKQDLKNPALHTANALAYQLRTKAGEREMFELAETGYLVALEQQHDFYHAAIQLAHLYLENKQFAKAQRAAAYAIKLDAKSIEALYLLAGASYSLGDAEIALWAIDQAKNIAPNNAQGIRMLPTIYGSAGLTEEALAYLNNHQTAFSVLDMDKVQARISQWKITYNTALLAANTHNDTKATSVDNTDATNNEDDIKSSAKNSADKAVVDGPLAYAWSDCVQQLTEVKVVSEDSSSSSDSSSTGAVKIDETMAMPSLPSPCKGRPMPQMAIIDIVILRTNEVSTSSSGINLLENLAVTIQQSSNKVTTSVDNEASSISSTLTRNVGLGTSAGAAIAYSLNIANISGQTTEVVSRPSLQVLDRQPAKFFSGSSIQIGLPGAIGGTSSLNEVNVGLSMSVTPTFLDDSEILLNVKAVHTFFEPVTGTSSFSQSLQTSRNMVASATKIRVNETLVLSGLTEREAISGTSGVPVLKDIPGLQFLFSKKTTQNFNKTVLILITPRKIMAYGETLDKVDALKSTNNKEPKVLHDTRILALKALGGSWPNLYRTFESMTRSERAFGVRANDIELEDWSQPSRIKKILDDAMNTLYF
jgi:Tfp pilus assembly protein PilF